MNFSVIRMESLLIAEREVCSIKKPLAYAGAFTYASSAHRTNNWSLPCRIKPSVFDG